jgi:hypothetical protein
VHDDEPVRLDGLRVEFDDEHAVSDAGVTLVATLAKRLGIEAIAGRLVSLRRDRPGAANAGRKVMALLFAMVLGADSIDDCELLRAGKTRRLLGGWIPAPSTLGTFVRALTFGHVRQLDALLGEALVRAWRAAAPSHIRGDVSHTRARAGGDHPRRDRRRTPGPDGEHRHACAARLQESGRHHRAGTMPDPARRARGLLCFATFGDPVASRTSPPPTLSDAELATVRERADALAAQLGIELV